MVYEKILYSVEDHIATITLNEPKVLNPMTGELLTEVLDALKRCEADADVRTVVLCGAGRAFCGGGDIRSFVAEVVKPGFDLEPGLPVVGDVVKHIRNIPKPVICKLHGAAAGGGANLALACDIIIAADNMLFMEAFVNIGLAPDTGGIYSLPRMIGPSRAFEMLSTGRAVYAEEALNLGLVSKVVPMEELDAAVAKLAHKYANGPSVAYANLKKMMNFSMYDRLDDFLKVEAKCVGEASRSEDFKEGVFAFTEKRKPVYKGK